MRVSLIDMSDYSRAGKIYWSVIVTVGTLTAAWGLYNCASLTSIEWMQFLALLGLVVITSSYPIRIPGTKANITTGDAFVFLGVMLVGVSPAIVLGVVDSFVGSRRTTKRAASLVGAPAMMAIAVFLSGTAYYFVLGAYFGIHTGALGSTPINPDELLIPLTVMMLLQYVLNGIALAILSALESRQSVWRFWCESYIWTAWTFIAGAAAAAIVYEAISKFGVAYALVGVPVVAATYGSYQVVFDRVSEKVKEASDWKRLHLATVEALATAIDAKDQTTHFHVRRVQLYSSRLARLLNLSEAEIQALKAGALLHDIGKLAVPDHILNKPGRLTAAEFEKMKIHTSVGAEILGRVNFPYPVVPIVRHHHEQWNGGGYPDGLRGQEIPITARILSVVDCFDSVREDRPYRRGMSREEASALLLRGAGVHFDPRIVELFLKHLPEFEKEVAQRGLDRHGVTVEECEPRSLAVNHKIEENFYAYDQIKNAHREVFSLYEIARTFGSSLDIEETSSILVNKVGHVVPFDTCVVYLYDEMKGYARAAHVAGKNAEALKDRCIAPGEGATGFALANQRPISRIDPQLDFCGVKLENGTDYRGMVALPLVKDDRTLGVLSVYSMELSDYSEDHMRLLDTVTRLASDALANAIQHAEAESNALTDPLTALPNARCMYVRFEQEVSRAHRTGRPFQVIMLDLDDFKQVNDTFGHKIGDQMLREIARLLQSQLRDYDFLARYAGDEFVAIVQDLAEDQVEELIQRIERTISGFSMRVRSDKHAKVGISVGKATYGTDGDALDQLLIAADQKMYSAKSAHKEKRRIKEIEAARPPVLSGSLATEAVN